MTKVEIIVQLTASLNAGGCSVNSSYTERVDLASKQFDRMIDLGIINEEDLAEDLLNLMNDEGIKVGDIAVCIAGGGDYLTHGQLYYILGEDDRDNQWEVIDDDGDREHYEKSLFVSSAKWEKIKHTFK